MANKGNKLEEYRRKKALEERKKREKEYKKANKIKKKINRPASKPQPFKGERISPMDDVDFVRQTPTERRNSQKDFFAFDERKANNRKSRPKKNSKSAPKNKKKPVKKVNHQDFFGKNVKGSGVYEDREYIDKSKVKKRGKKGISRKALLRLKILAYVLVVAVVLMLGLTLSLTVFFKTEQFKVTGDTQYSSEEIINASGIALGENIFLADKETASQNIVNAFPYVAGADVSFSLPDTITIKIAEGKACYLVKFEDKKYCVVSSEGRILSNTDKPKSGLPEITGVQLKDSTPGAYVQYSDDSLGDTVAEIVQSVELNEFEKLSSIDVTDKKNITLTYDNRILVKMGMPEDIDYKIRTAKTIIIEKLDPNNTGVIEGILDVSSCNETKRSYFNEEAIATTESTSTTQPTTVADNSVDYGTNDGVVDYGTYDSGVDYGTYDSGIDYGTYDSGVDYGTYDSGVDYGTYDSGVDYGAYDSGVDYGAYDSGVDYGTYDSGIDYGSADYGVVQ